MRVDRRAFPRFDRIPPTGGDVPKIPTGRELTQAFQRKWENETQPALRAAERERARITPEKLEILLVKFK